MEERNHADYFAHMGATIAFISFHDGVPVCISHSIALLLLYSAANTVQTREIIATSARCQVALPYNLTIQARIISGIRETSFAFIRVHLRTDP